MSRNADLRAVVEHDPELEAAAFRACGICGFEFVSDATPANCPGCGRRWDA